MKGNSERPWKISASEASVKTVNKIRQIVDKLDLNKVPKDKPFISKERRSKKKKKIGHYYFVTIGDPTKFPNLKPSPEVTKAVRAALESTQCNGYAPSFGVDEARIALAKQYSYPHVKVDKSDVFLGSGCSDAINMAFGALLDSGDNVLLPRPGFSFYETVCGRYDFECRFYNCLPDKGWNIDTKQLETLIDGRTKAILINNPSNPCGSILTRKNLEDVLQVAKKHRIPIIADEIYDGMVFGEIPFIKKRQAFVLQFSFFIYFFFWICNEKIKKLKGQRGIGPNSLIQAALPTILAETPKSFYKQLNDTLRTQANLFHELFEKIPELKPIKAHGAMYMMVGIETKKMHLKDDVEFANLLLREEGVLVLPGSIFGIPNYFRVVTCPPPDAIKEVAKRMDSFCKRHSSQRGNKAKL
ncbi:hypothetical protein RFI_01313 [Reticulomyxa filosa]|uniref:Aminotransferase class I/classII large domain-containing protein n=1 Tax=Reticulomyxa filosa TaxID=46433 RepID=X6PB25_RETFI|nr:hypothetical protein RFI_01313 [Reticulomyxa filosa]|eukprot:ETO35750.1 hypothetical protein RFI_01313 [Reticulomyxa filosa]